MATYDELQSLADVPPYSGRIERAITIKADKIKDEATPSQDRLDWASKAFNDPNALVKGVWNAMLAANEGSTVAAITGASDATIQTNVDAAVDGIVR